MFERIDGDIRPIIGEYPWTQAQPQRRTWPGLWKGVLSGISRFFAPEVVIEVDYPRGQRPETSAGTIVVTPGAIVRPGFHLTPEIRDRYGHCGLAKLAAALEFIITTKKAEKALPLSQSDDEQKFRKLSRALILNDTIMPLVEEPHKPQVINYDQTFVDCGSFEDLKPTVDNSALPTKPTREEELLAAYSDLCRLVESAPDSWEDSLRLTSDQMPNFTLENKSG